MAPLGSGQGCPPAEALQPSQGEPSSNAHGASKVRRASVWALASWNVCVCVCVRACACVCACTCACVHECVGVNALMCVCRIILCGRHWFCVCLYVSTVCMCHCAPVLGDWSSSLQLPILLLPLQLTNILFTTYKEPSTVSFYTSCLPDQNSLKVRCNCKQRGLKCISLPH